MVNGCGFVCHKTRDSIYSSDKTHRPSAKERRAERCEHMVMSPVMYGFSLSAMEIPQLSLALESKVLRDVA